MAEQGPRYNPRVPATLEKTVKKLLKTSLAMSTRKMYINVLKKFFHFCKKQFALDIRVPVPSSCVVSYIAYMYNLGYSPSTIVCHMSPISFVHKLANVVDPTTSFLVKKLLLGCQKSKANSGALRLPVLPHTLYKLIDNVKFLTADMYVIKLLTAMLLLAFHCFLRIGEYAMTKHSKHLLQVSQITLITKHGKHSALLVTFNSFKHSKGQKVTLRVKSTKGPYCPVQAVVKYINVRGLSQGPLFWFRDKTPVSASYFYNMFKSLVTLSKLDTKTIKPHSLRIGAATAAAAKGHSDQQICAMGRWQSSAFKKYIRIPTLQP